MPEWSSLAAYCVEFILIAFFTNYFLQPRTKKANMTPNNTGQCPPPPPSSPASRIHHADSSSQQPQHHQPQVPQQQEIANLLQYAQTSYQSNPTDALSSLLDALTLSTGTNTAAQHAIDRIRNELGDVVAESVSSRVNPRYATLQQHQNQLQQHNASNGGTAAAMNEHLSEREMTLKAMAVVQELLDDSSTILYTQGRQHLLQQAMEDGSSVVCSNCGDMIARERWIQHAKYWCSAIVVEGEDGKGDDDEDVAMDD